VPQTPRVVLAYSGVSSAKAIPQLAAAHRADVVTLTVDLGQGRVLEAVRDRALDRGALRAHVMDARDEFAREFLIRAIRADVPDLPDVRIAVALARPLVAKKLSEIADIEDAAAIAYAACGRGKTFQALEAPLASLASGRRIVAADVPDDRQAQPLVVKTPEECPANAAYVDVSFERGIPTAINGVAMPVLDLIESLGTIAAAHGLGASRPRDLRDAPAIGVLRAAHLELRRAAAPPEVDALLHDVAKDYVAVLQSGGWFTLRRETLDIETTAANQPLNGDVRLKLLQGAITCERVHPRPPGEPPRGAIAGRYRLL